MAIPSSHRASTSIAWTFAFADYRPADGWSATVWLTSESGTVIEITASASADNLSFEVTEDAAYSDAWVAGPYVLEIEVTKASDAHVPSHATLNVIQKRATANADLTAKRAELTAIDAAIAALISGGAVQEMRIQTSVGERQLSYLTLAELRQHRAWLVGQVDKLMVKLGLRSRALTGWRPVKVSLS
jgi:hypothetical protein